MKMKNKRIAVIGAGASGLAAAAHLVENFEFDALDVYEAADRIGGRYHHFRTSQIYYYDQRCSPGTLKILALQKWYFGVALFHSNHFTPKPDFRLNFFINKKLSNFAENVCALRAQGLLAAHKFSAKLVNFLLMKMFNRKSGSKYNIFGTKYNLIPRQICVKSRFGALKQQNTAPSALP